MEKNRLFKEDVKYNFTLEQVKDRGKPHVLFGGEDAFTLNINDKSFSTTYVQFIK